MYESWLTVNIPEVTGGTSALWRRPSGACFIFRGSDPCGPQLSKPPPTESPLKMRSGSLDVLEGHSGMSRSITPPSDGRGQIRILSDHGKWYYGSYGHPRESHLRSFNRVLYP
jgi:hypothetical protein